MFVSYCLLDKPDLFCIGDRIDSNVRSIIGLNIPLLMFYFMTPYWVRNKLERSDSDSVKNDDSDSSDLPVCLRYYFTVLVKSKLVDFPSS